MKSKLQLKSDIAKVRKATGNAELREALEQVLTGIVDSLGTGKVTLNNIIGTPGGASGDLAELVQAFISIFEYDKKEGALRIILDAPASFASCTIIRPMAPSPITSTVLPGRTPAMSMPRRQQARGSVIAPYSSGIFLSRSTHCFSGTTHFSAKPPSRFTPTANRFRHMFFLPILQ